jgi:ligand-binding sensor domain-containing protein
LCAVSRGVRLNLFDGQRFQTVVPKLFGGAGEGRSESYYAATLHDSTGEWWIPSGNTLYRFPAVKDPAFLAETSPKAVYRLGDEPGSRGIWRLFEDSRGDVWIGKRIPTGEVLARLQRDGTIHRYFPRHGLPLSAVNAFAEDREGNIWIGFWDASLGRYRRGRFQTFSEADGVSKGFRPARRRGQSSLVRHVARRCPHRQCRCRAATCHAHRAERARTMPSSRSPRT